MSKAFTRLLGGGLWRRKAKGQAMPILALLLGTGALTGLIALAFDGGSALLQRRAMQNAATAAALGGTALLGQALAVSCNPAPCHPTYLTTNVALLAQVTYFAAANRGGAPGAQEGDYTVTAEYHYMAGSPAPCSDCYAPVPQDPAAPFVPEFVDGVRVSAQINLRTTFARAINVNTIPVGAPAAARLYPTCPAPPATADPVLPLTRLRPAFEAALADPTQGNSLCHPLEFWQWQGDGLTIPNLLSFNANSFHPQSGSTPQLLTPDPRYPGSGSPTEPAATQDLHDWIVGRWQGSLALGRPYAPATMTYYPAQPATDWGQCCGAQLTRPGDWAETEYTGTVGQAAASAVAELTAGWGSVTPLSGAPLNWGRAVTVTVDLWGEPVLPSAADSQSALQVTPPCAIPPCPAKVVWQDVAVRGSYRAYQADGPISRVRLTRAVTFVFYENLQGSYGASTPAGCPAFSSPAASAWGILPSADVAGPLGRTCPTGWQPGGAVYAREIAP